MKDYNDGSCSCHLPLCSPIQMRRIPWRKTSNFDQYGNILIGMLSIIFKSSVIKYNREHAKRNIKYQ
jgi:hypothetical protein